MFKELRKKSLQELGENSTHADNVAKFLGNLRKQLLTQGFNKEETERIILTLIEGFRTKH